MKRKWLAIIVVCSLFIGSATTYLGIKWTHQAGTDKEQQEQVKKKTETEGQPSKNKSNPDLSKLEQAYELIANSYVEKVNDKQLIEGAIQGMLASLNDPYSVYMDAETAAQFNDTLESSFHGIGAEVTVRDGKLIIIAPFKNSPAEKAGIKPRDQIVSIDGESVEGLDLYEATLKIRGEKGTIVTLGIVREGIEKPLNIKVKRDEIPLETVFADIKKHKGKSIGYVEITSFSQETSADFKKEIAKLEKKKIDGLIIDVRGNPGGLLLSVEDILQEFVTDKKPYVQIEQRDGKKTEQYSELKESKPYPITVLIDGGSASASEILAGALKEVEGYTLVGEHTFGKGTVQQAVPLEDGSNIKLTMFKWLTPNGNWIHQDGIAPTIEVKQPEYFYIHPLEVQKPLKKDMNSEQVQIAQVMLKGLGFGTGRTDGYFSEQTEKAVKAFQYQAKLQQSGVIDKETAAAIEDSILEEIEKEENDMQLQAALSILTKENN